MKPAISATKIFFGSSIDGHKCRTIFYVRSPGCVLMNQVKQRLPTLLSVLIITPAGFYTKFYDGPAAQWVNNYLGGTFYVIFWSLVVYLFLPSRKTWMITSAVLVVTCLLEFLQLYNHDILELMRSSFIGVTLLGSSFSWFDFPWYFLGAGIGWLWIERIPKTSDLS